MPRTLHIALYLALSAQAAAGQAGAEPSAGDSRWQQHTDYRIEASLDETTAVLTGRMRLEYHNNAPTSIDTLWFHLHLNAFRPNSAWARRELESGETRFQELRADQHAFERVRTPTVDGVPVQAVFPLAPDSTVMALPLSAAVPPGGRATVRMDWAARLSTVPRRQARWRRDYDFAHWYPRIAVYDTAGWQVQPLLPQGEFFGEFGSWDVTLELAADQVVGATGVPVEGDPGWARVAARGGTTPDYRRDYYISTDAEPLGLLAGPAEGRRHVRWRADDVHHFAWSISPNYVYEGGRYGDVAVHVLYKRGDVEWAGVVVERTEDALAFYDTIFGPFAWPQITNVRRIEGGGTEFPMLMMNGSPSSGLILHETGHNYLQGIIANNEWRDGWLDEGFVEYLTRWAHELAGRPVDWQSDMANIIDWEQAGATQPIGLAGAEFVDFATYGAMTYTRAMLVFRMLHHLMGDEAWRAALRRYYEDNRLRHVTEADLRAAVNAVSPEPLDWFFDQWIHTTDVLDYRIGELTTRRDVDGRWLAQVEVIRQGAAWMPVTLRVGDVSMTLDSRERRQLVEVVTSQRPDEAVLDPDRILIDVRPGNNRRIFPR
jgi:hypothetical protein